MTAAALHQRCWNHEGREAVCRCPECGRSFCRECVTEHHRRLLCAACLARLARQTEPRTQGRRNLLAAAMLFGGVVLAWLLFFGAGEGILALAGRG
ncbi:MAG: hypothetical protein P4L56_01600 [Candidatus Sulfopaludibacter sp.]|nr:hypothetical protein [Candidatus Sulfopaludibacter sp.]